MTVPGHMDRTKLRYRYERCGSATGAELEELALMGYGISSETDDRKHTHVHERRAGNTSSETERLLIRSEGASPEETADRRESSSLGTPQLHHIKARAGR